VLNRALGLWQISLFGQALEVFPRASTFLLHPSTASPPQQLPLGTPRPVPTTPDDQPSVNNQSQTSPWAVSSAKLVAIAQLITTRSRRVLRTIIAGASVTARGASCVAAPFLTPRRPAPVPTTCHARDIARDTVSPRIPSSFMVRTLLRMALVGFTPVPIPPGGSLPLVLLQTGFKTPTKSRIFQSNTAFRKKPQN
jgi:hypothetical protein